MTKDNKTSTNEPVESWNITKNLILDIQNQTTHRLFADVLVGSDPDLYHFSHPKLGFATLNDAWKE